MKTNIICSLIGTGYSDRDIQESLSVCHFGKVQQVNNIKMKSGLSLLGPLWNPFKDPLRSQKFGKQQLEGTWLSD